MDREWIDFIGKTIAKVTDYSQNRTYIEFTDGTWLVLRGWDDGSVLMTHVAHLEARK